MNQGIFSGNIGRDAELRSAPNGDRVCNFPLAVETGTKAEPKTMWVDCSLWGKRADSLGQYLTKGTKVTISGRLTFGEFKKQTGENAYRIMLNIAELDLHGGKPSEARAAAKPAVDPAIDDDMPF